VVLVPEYISIITAASPMSRSRKGITLIAAGFFLQGFPLIGVRLRDYRNCLKLERWLPPQNGPSTSPATAPPALLVIKITSSDQKAQEQQQQQLQQAQNLHSRSTRKRPAAPPDEQARLKRPPVLDAQAGRDGAGGIPAAGGGGPGTPGAAGTGGQGPEVTVEDAAHATEDASGSQAGKGQADGAAQRPAGARQGSRQSAQLTREQLGKLTRDVDNLLIKMLAGNLGAVSFPELAVVLRGLRDHDTPAAHALADELNRLLNDGATIPEGVRLSLSMLVINWRTTTA
jgi:hypothetical protein